MVYHEGCVNFASKVIVEIENNVFGNKSHEKISQETYKNTRVLKQKVIESEPNAYKICELVEEVYIL